MKRNKVICSLILMTTLVFSTTNTFAALVSERLPDYTVASSKLSENATFYSATHVKASSTSKGSTTLTDGYASANDGTTGKWIYMTASSSSDTTNNNVHLAMDLGAVYDINKISIWSRANSVTYLAGWKIYGTNDSNVMTTSWNSVMEKTLIRDFSRDENKTVGTKVDDVFTEQTLNLHLGDTTVTSDNLNEILSNLNSTEFRYLMIVVDDNASYPNKFKNIAFGEIEVYGSEVIKDGYDQNFVTDYRPFVSNNEKFTHGFKATLILLREQLI